MARDADAVAPWCARRGRRALVLAGPPDQDQACEGRESGQTLREGAHGVSAAGTRGLFQPAQDQPAARPQRAPASDTRARAGHALRPGEGPLDD